MKKDKTILQRILFGIKKGWNTPTLPEDKIQLTLHPLIRILRFTGGLSFLIILGRTQIIYPAFVLYICMFIATIYTMYHIYLSICRFKHIRYLIKSGKMDIYN